MMLCLSSNWASYGFSFFYTSVLNASCSLHTWKEHLALIAVFPHADVWLELKYD